MSAKTTYDYKEVTVGVYICQNFGAFMGGTTLTGGRLE